MLNGVGGRTIAEAKERLSYREFHQWLRYRRLRGSMHPGMRIERGSALLATLYANAHSKQGGYRLSDFMPHEDEQPITLDEALSAWG